MDISGTWKKLEQEKLEKPIEGDLKRPGHSAHPVEKLKRNYKIKAVMMVVFVVCFLGLYLVFDQWLIKVILLILAGAYLIFLITSLSMYNKLASELPIDGTLLNMLVKTRDRVSMAMKFETISSLLIFPFAGTAGYMMGYTVSGLDPGKIFESSGQVVIFAGVLIAFGILGYFLGRKLMKEGYGRYLEEIDERVRDLKGS